MRLATHGYRFHDSCTGEKKARIARAEEEQRGARGHFGPNILHFAINGDSSIVKYQCYGESN